MKKFVKYLSFVFLAAGMICTPALSEASQVSPNDHRCTRQMFYGRTDGDCFETTEKTPVRVNAGSVSADKNSPAFYVDFTDQGAQKEIYCHQFDWTAWDTTALMVNHCEISNGFKFAVQPYGTATKHPEMIAAALDISGDQIDNDGFDIAHGVYGANGRPFIVGRDGAFRTCASFAAANVSGSDDFHFGFREPHDDAAAGTAQAVNVNAAYASLRDYVSLGWNGTDALQNVDIETDLATVESVTDTGTDIADGQTMVFCVLVSAAGVVTYLIDAGTPTTVASYTFTDGSSVYPYFYLTQANADQTGVFSVYYWFASFD